MEISELEVFELRKQGLSIDKIAKKLNTYNKKIAYTLHPEQKAVQSLAKKKWQELNKESCNASSLKTRQNPLSNTLFKEKMLSAYGRRNKGKYLTSDLPTIDDFIEKFGRKETYTCYLTGKEIEAKSISLDHVIPFKNLENKTPSLDNIKITTWILNRMKGDLELSEFIQICKSVADYNN